MPESKNNAWQHGPAYFEPPVFPRGTVLPDGLVPVPSTINLEVGQEVVLYLKDSTAFINTLAKTRPFNLRVHGGVAQNKFGCLGFFVFWIPSPFNPNVPLVIYDSYVNLQNQALLGLWRELAFQTHWHLFLIDRRNEQRDFLEFANTFRIHDYLEEMQRYCQGIPILDFERAKTEFMAEKSIEDLFDDAPTTSEKSENGLSIYDQRFAIPQPSESSSPLKAARYVRIVRESAARHSVGDTHTSSAHLGDRLSDLKSQVSKKKIVYLDVCHWINLRHVWLQSSKAMPMYERILVCLNKLALQQSVLCPLSTPIFEELMKQLDCRSRAATANLMDIFSQGISLMKFEEAFAQQCCNEMARGEHEVQFNTNFVSKVGLWFDDEPVREALWSADISKIWDKVSIDLRWEMTVGDCQKLTAQGIAPHLEKRSFFSKWAELPNQQKSDPKPFWELSKRCRSDVIADYLAQVISTMEITLGGTPPEKIRTTIHEIAEKVIDSQDYGRIPCCEVVAGMCAAQVFRGGKLRPNDIFDFLHAGAGIPSSEAYFCDGPMEHLLRSKALKLDERFKVTVRSKPEDLLNYLEEVLAATQSLPGKS